MAVTLLTSRNALIPLAKAVIFSFTQNESLKKVRIHNTTSANVEVTIWFDPTGTLAGDQQEVFSQVLGKHESLHLDNLFNPESGGSITAEATTNNVVAVLISGVTR